MMRLPAAKLNSSLATSVIGNLPDIEDIFDLSAMSAGEVGDATARKARLIKTFEQSRVSSRRSTLLAIDLQVTVFPDRIEASFCPKRFGKLIAPAIETSPKLLRQRFDVPASLQRRGVELKLRLDPVGDNPSDRNENLLNLIVRSFAAREQLEGANYSAPSQMRRELARVARISFLAPDIILSIFEGRQPGSLRARKLERIGELPICWKAQRSLLGFV
jgi:site-specific DNA recombinase